MKFCETVINRNEIFFEIFNTSLSENQPQTSYNIDYGAFHIIFFRPFVKKPRAVL